jgi:hypothetical protein
MHARMIAVTALLLVSLAGAAPAFADPRGYGQEHEHVNCWVGPEPGSYADCGEPIGWRMSLTRVGEYIPLRVLQITMYFGPIDRMTAMDTTDSHFTKVRGLSNPDCVSFESVKRPGRFLRHHGPDTRVELADGWFDPWFREDATFCPRRSRNFSSPEVLEFESVNHRGYFLRKTGDHLVLSHSDSAYPYEIGFVEGSPVSLGSPVNWLLGDWINHYKDGSSKAERSGVCTGLTPFLGAPRRKSISVTLSTGRVITSTATSTPYMGFYPRITLNGRAQNPTQVHSFKKAVLPCVW